MLSYTTCIHMHSRKQSAREILLSEFETGRDEAMKDIPTARVNKNIEMLAADLKKHEFSPEFDEYLAGFSMTAKRLLYRLPSLISADLATILAKPSGSSFDCIESWQEKSACFSTQLKTLLALACFIRLRCYLGGGSSHDEFQLHNPQQDGDTKDVDCIRQTHLKLLFERRKVVTMAATEFKDLCMRLLVVQNSVMPISTCITKDDIELELSKISLKEGNVDILLAIFYSHDWSGTLTAASQISIPDIPKHSALKVLNAKARAHLQRKEYKDATAVFEKLLCEQIDANSNMDVLRGLAHCYEGLGSLERALEMYTKAREITGCSLKKKVKLQFEIARVNALLHEHNTTCLEMLFKALIGLTVYEATSGGSETENLQQKYLECNYQDFIPFLCNASRQIAHCAYILGKVLVSKDEELGRLFFEKAQSLGLSMVIDENVDQLTRAITLNELGKRFRNLDCLHKANVVLEMSKYKHTELGKLIDCEIHMSEGKCYTAPTLHVRVGLSADTLTKLNSVIKSEMISEEETWAERSRNAIKCAYPDSNEEGHVYYAKIFKTEGDRVRKKGGDLQRVHEWYAKAAEIYENHDCQLKAAQAYKADGEVYKHEGKWYEAERCLRKALKNIKDAFPHHHENRSDYHEILLNCERVLHSRGEALLFNHSNSLCLTSGSVLQMESILI